MEGGLLVLKDFKTFEENIINNLKNSDLIKRFNISVDKPTPNFELIVKLFEESMTVSYDDHGLYFIGDDNEKIYCPIMYTTISDKGFWFSDKLPDIGFDVDMGGNVRKADEAEALYCCTCISNILKEENFKDELKEVARGYDFSSMKPISDGEMNFRDLLNSWLELQSIIINVLTSACKYKISDFKKDNEKFLRDGLKDTEVVELRELEAKIRSINFSYSEGVLSPSEIKKMTKIERLQKIDERDEAISREIINSKVGTLYKILNLSTEYISPVSKKRITTFVQKEVDNLLSKKENEDLKEERSNLISRLTRRALKFEKTSVRKIFVEKYINEQANFKMPSKQ